MLIENTVITKEISMVAAIALSKRFWVIFAKDLEVILILINETFDNVINLDRYRLISIEKTIVLALASRAFKLSLLSNAFLSVCLVFDHLSSDTLSACGLPATEHDYRLSLVGVEPMFAIKAAQ
jgi:hypothetical protein